MILHEWLSQIIVNDSRRDYKPPLVENKKREKKPNQSLQG